MAHARIRTSYDLGPEGTILVATSGADPAAGAEISVTVPGRAVWEVLALRFTLVADSNASNRFVVVELDDGTSTFVSVQPPNVQVASETFAYSYYQGADAATDLAGVLRQPLPLGLAMLPGWRIRTATTGLLAGDNFGAPVLYVREVPQRGVEVGQDALLSALRRLIDREV